MHHGNNARYWEPAGCNPVCVLHYNAAVEQASFFIVYEKQEVRSPMKGWSPIVGNYVSDEGILCLVPCVCRARVMVN